MAEAQATGLRSLKDHPFDLLREIERRSKTALAGATGQSVDVEEWVGIGFRLGDEQFVVARDRVREVLMVPPFITRVPGAKAWLRGLPKDLQDTFVAVVHEVCADIRTQTQQQEEDAIAKPKAAGVMFFNLADADMANLRSLGDVAHKKYAPEINRLYDGDTYRPADYLAEVQQLMGYTP